MSLLVLFTTHKHTEEQAVSVPDHTVVRLERCGNNQRLVFLENDIIHASIGNIVTARISRKSTKTLKASPVDNTITITGDVKFDHEGMPIGGNHSHGNSGTVPPETYPGQSSRNWAKNYKTYLATVDGHFKKDGSYYHYTWTTSIDDIEVINDKFILRKVAVDFNLGTELNIITKAENKNMKVSDFKPGRLEPQLPDSTYKVLSVIKEEILISSLLPKEEVTFTPVVDENPWIIIKTENMRIAKEGFFWNHESRKSDFPISGIYYLLNSDGQRYYYNTANFENPTLLEAEIKRFNESIAVMMPLNNTNAGAPPPGTHLVIPIEKIFYEDNRFYYLVKGDGGRTIRRSLGNEITVSLNLAAKNGSTLSYKNIFSNDQLQSNWGKWTLLYPYSPDFFVMDNV